MAARPNVSFYYDPGTTGVPVETIRLTPDTAQVDTGVPVVLTAQMLAADGSLVTGYNAAVTFQQVTPGETGSFSPGTVVQAVNGVATVSYTPSSDGLHAIEALIGAITSNQSLITAQLPVPVATSLEVLPGSAQAEVDEPVGYTVRVLDQYGNLFPSTALISMLPDSTDANATWTPGDSQAAVGGIANFTFSYAIPQGNTGELGDEPIEIEAQTAGLPSAVGFLVVGNAPVATTINLQPAFATLDEGQDLVMTIEVFDQYGNLFTDPVAQITMDDGAADGTFDTTTPTLTNGVGTVTYTAGTAATGITITASNGSETDGTATVDVNAPPAQAPNAPVISAGDWTT